MKILCCDGGGIRGIYAAHILKKIQENWEVSFSRDFDLISGTSTGSIIAAAIAFDIAPEEVCGLYREHGSYIFKKNFFRGWMLTSKYPTSRLKNRLCSVFGDRKLWDAKVPLLIPSVDISNGNVYVFKSNYSTGFVRDKEVKAVDAILASCSAPTYFPPYRVGPYQLCDGGLWANNPTMACIVEALSRFSQPLSNLNVLSIGTGFPNKTYPIKKKFPGWGFLTGWRKSEFVEFILNLQAKTAENTAKILLNGQNYLRLNFSSDRPLPLDNVDEIDDLISKADHEFTYRAKDIDLFLKKSGIIK